MATKKIIFDWDGTLARTLDMWLEGYRVSFAHRGHAYDDATIASEFFHNHHLVIEKYPDMGFHDIAEDARQHVANNLAQVELYDDAIELLDGVAAKGLHMSLVSSSRREMLEIGLGAHGLQSRFASVIGGDCGFGHKPSPAPFEETLRRAGMSAEETMIIGDSQVDIQAGKTIGCRTCLFWPARNRLFHDEATLMGAGPDIVVERLTDLLDAL